MNSAGSAWDKSDRVDMTGSDHHLAGRDLFSTRVLTKEIKSFSSRRRSLWHWCLVSTPVSVQTDRSIGPPDHSALSLQVLRSTGARWGTWMCQQVGHVHPLNLCCLSCQGLSIDPGGQKEKSLAICQKPKRKHAFKDAETTLLMPSWRGETLPAGPGR